MTDRDMTIAAGRAFGGAPRLPTRSEAGSAWDLRETVAAVLLVAAILGLLALLAIGYKRRELMAGAPTPALSMPRLSMPRAMVLLAPVLPKVRPAAPARPLAAAPAPEVVVPPPAAPPAIERAQDVPVRTAAAHEPHDAPVSNSRYATEDAGPAFDCQPPFSFAEEKICANDGLSQQNRDLGQAFRAAEAAGVPRARLRDEQSRWAKARTEAAYTTPWRLPGLYAARIDELAKAAGDMDQSFTALEQEQELAGAGR